MFQQPKFKSNEVKTKFVNELSFLGINLVFWQELHLLF